MSADPGHSVRRDTTSAVAATVAGALPVFLVGSLAVQMRADVHLPADRLGAVVAVYFLGAALASTPFGRLAERLGGLRTMRWSCAASAVLLLLIGTVARSALVLGVLMLLAGASSAAMQPSTNLFLARRVPPSRLGSVFGIKQAAVPITASIGGLTVPVVALTVGWRWAFVLGAAWAVVTLLAMPRPRESLAQRRARGAAPAAPIAVAPLLVLAGAFALGIAAASALSAFMVTGAVAAGLGHGSAGLLAALGGAAAAASRILTGLRADQRGRRHLPVVAGMLALGALGYVGLALDAQARLHVLLIPAVLLAYAAGWGWNGLFNFAVVRTHPDAPARATGIVQTGGRVGGVIGPAVFGLVVVHGDFRLAWLLTAAAALVASGVMLLGRRMLVRSRAGLAASG